MANGIYVAVSGATSRTQQLDVLSNNLANVQTTGFKRAEVSFHSVQVGEENRNGEPGDRHFVETHEARPVLYQGEMIRTDNPLDLAIQGDAFFKIESNGEDRLTRDGRMLIGQDGLLRTMSGDLVQDEQGGSIFLPPEHVPRIDSEGRIYSENVEIARLGLLTVGDAQLERDGTYRFMVPEDAQPLEVGSGTLVQQGWLEGSNARPVELLVDLVDVHRAYDAMHRAISTYQEMDRSAIRVTR